MAIDRKAAFSRMNLARRLDQGDDERKRLQTNRRLEKASIGAGGLRVLDGFIVILDAAGNEQMRLSTDGLTMEGLLAVLGNIHVQGGAIIIFDGDGNETLRLSTDGLRLLGSLEIDGGMNVNDGGDLHVDDGANLEIEGGGRLQALHADGTVSTAFGPIWNGALTEVVGDGILVQDNAAAANNDILSIRRDNTTGIPRVIIDPGESGDGAGDGVRIRTNTTTGSANMLHAGGISSLRRVTSAARFKVDVKDHAVDPAKVLSMRSRAWRDAGEVERDPKTDRWHVGLIANELDELGLTEFVDYDENGEPLSITYDRLTVALLAVLKSQQQQVDELTAWAQEQGFKPSVRASSTASSLPKRLPEPVSEDKDR